MSTFCPLRRASDADCVILLAESSIESPVSFDSAMRTAASLETRLPVIGRLRIPSTRRAQVCAKNPSRNSSLGTPLFRSARLASVAMCCTIPSIDSLVRFASDSTAAIPERKKDSGSPSTPRMRRAPCSISEIGKSCSSLIGIVGTSRVLLLKSVFLFLESKSKSKERESEGEEHPPPLLNPVDVSDKPFLRE
jgi:hypothetical protein